MSRPVVKDLQFEIDKLRYLLSRPGKEIHEEYRILSMELDEVYAEVAHLEKELDRTREKLKETEAKRLSAVAKYEHMKLFFDKNV